LIINRGMLSDFLPWMGKQGNTVGDTNQHEQISI
jgi:hypothetical protein